MLYYDFLGDIFLIFPFFFPILIFSPSRMPGYSSNSWKSRIVVCLNSGKPRYFFKKKFSPNRNFLLVDNEIYSANFFFTFKLLAYTRNFGSAAAAAISAAVRTTPAFVPGGPHAVSWSWTRSPAGGGGGGGAAAASGGVRAGEEEAIRAAEGQIVVFVSCKARPRFKERDFGGGWLVRLIVR